MIETNIPGVDIDRLMEKARLEINKAQEYQEKNGIALKAGCTSIDLTHDKGRFPSEFPNDELPLVETRKFRFHANEFLKYEDREFIMRAYEGVLWRRPDSDGFEYFLNYLRSGMMSKTEVLLRLRFSPEGRERRVKVEGLFWNFLRQSAFRRSMVGLIGRTVASVIRSRDS